MAECKAALRALKAASKDDDEFFDREREMKDLLTLLEVGSKRIVVLIGPSNSGKSACLRRLQSLWESDKRLKTNMPMFYLDMRLSDVRTPALAAAKIGALLRTWLTWFHSIAIPAAKGLRVTYKGVSFDATSLAAALAEKPEADLASVMSAFTGLAYSSNPDLKPVFIIDEVDKLKAWSSDDLATLMDGFVAMTKQDHRAVVIMSSSDEFFSVWFHRHVNVPQWTPLGIGHFSENSAKQFYLRLLKQHGASQVTVADEEWAKIYAVCGGSALDLENLVTDAIDLGKDLEAILEGKVDSAKVSVDRGSMGSTEADGSWERDKFKAVVRLIVDNKGAVGYPVVCRKVYGKNKEAAAAQIKAMLRANMIHVRFAPADVCYDDLDRGQDKKSKSFIMARSPPHFAAMKLFLEEGEEEEEEEGKEP